MEPELAFIRAEIEQDRSKPLDRKSIIPLFNEYILRLCDIQNSFATRLESSFSTLENRLERAETLLQLLEKRVRFYFRPPRQLNDWFQLERVNLDVEPTTVRVTQITNAEVPIEATIQEVVPEAQPATIEEEAQNMMKLRDHPVYNKYFKMLRLGIPEAAVKIKMSTEGVDPSLLRLGLVIKCVKVRYFSNPEKLVEAVKIEDSASSSESD